MKVAFNFITFWTIFSIHHIRASNEILSILSSAKDLTFPEYNALYPLFSELQKQYDYITSAIEAEGKSDVVPWQKEIWPETTNEDHIDLLDDIIVFPNDLPTIEYDVKLPTLKELIGITDLNNSNLTKEQMDELEDMQQILEETLEEAQSNIRELVRRAIVIESQLLKLNRPKIVMYVYRALSVLFRYSARLRRAAYCVYSHAPQLSDSLQDINGGVECYKYTSQMILRVQKQTVDSVRIIRKNVYELAGIYKKIAARKSIVGKIITTVLNLLRIARDVRESYSVAMKGLDELENKLPAAAEKSLNCGKDFAETIPKALETVRNVTTCVTFNGKGLVDPESEPENDFDFGDIN